jgi:hypothetical protein
MVSDIPAGAGKIAHLFLQCGAIIIQILLNMMSSGYADSNHNNADSTFCGR